jgi:hypothetical protein
LTKAYFSGNAPSLGINVFKYCASNFSICYTAGATGFTTPLWNGYPAAVCTPTTTTPVSTTTSSIPTTTTTVPATDWVPMNSGSTGILTTAWGTSPNNLFAAGGFSDASGVVLFYNGTAWSPIDSPYEVVFSMWGTSNSNIHTAGFDGLCHYDGSSWTCGGDTMIGVWGSSAENIFAVGGSGKILHYDGTSWSSMQSGTTVQLNSVWCSSGSDAFAVGSAGTILHYDGSSWTPMSSGTTNTLSGVWGSSGSDVFAVGGSGTILHYNGSAWSVITSGTANALSSVWGDSAADVFIVGAKGTILHYNGLSCSAMQSGTTNVLNDVWGFAGSDVFAVGYNGTILRYSRTATVINLSSFSATPKFGKVIVQWSTESETDNADFNIYRSESETGNYTKINPALIPAQGSSTQGASYEFTDNNVQNRKTYWYKLEDIDFSGVATMHGPVSATPRLIYGIGK